jgi:hypothetical protein
MCSQSALEWWSIWVSRWILPKSQESTDGETIMVKIFGKISHYFPNETTQLGLVLVDKGLNENVNQFYLK